MSGATGHFVAQRISAIALLLLGSWFVFVVPGLAGAEHAMVAAWAAKPVNSVLLMLLGAVLAYHSWLGVQIVIEDYVHAPGVLKFSLHAARIAHFVVAAVCVYAVYRVGFGA